MGAAKPAVVESAPSVPCDLVYGADDGPGITRKRSGDHFVYVDPDGKPVRDQAVIARINALAIPPAYEDVWICPDEKGHIQATGRDARGRKQYRYHEQWNQVRDATKYQQLGEFAAALPRIRRRVARDMQSRAMTQDKVVAVVVRLLELTLIRIGTRTYARTNKSYGLTTLRRRHTSVRGSSVRFRFKGKSGVQHDLTVTDRRIAAVIKRCMEIPGQELFQYQDAEGNVHRIDSGSVNAYLKEAGKADFTAKHYRTWAASVFALDVLQQAQRSGTRPTRAAVTDMLKAASRLLGNTPAVCRDCYIHPAIISAFLDGHLPERKSYPGPAGLNADERRFLAFLLQAC
ncbi:MAG TPA: DNA topoisomerase IB [Burkholderiaceae bacterium]|nr:DNA topoisomerase IB [Burkholderiaceae bacterium]